MDTNVVFKQYCCDHKVKHVHTTSKCLWPTEIVSISLFTSIHTVVLTFLQLETLTLYISVYYKLHRNNLS